MKILLWEDYRKLGSYELSLQEKEKIISEQTLRIIELETELHKVFPLDMENLFPTIYHYCFYFIFLYKSNKFNSV
jgi:hypothetical protein